LIRKYIDFYKSKKHKEIPNENLLPMNDPTVLFTTAGMHPIVPYLMGQKHPLGKRLVNVQRCIRTGDIDEVGDKSHHTFFEMLGNWSLGDYWKEDGIGFSFEFLTKVLRIPVDHLSISCFVGNGDAKKDEESAKIWLDLGISKDRIVFLGKEDNWWGPAGESGPCGPDTEMFYWKDKGKVPKKFNPDNKNWVEIGNDVLMQYVKTVDGEFKEADQKNVDFGGGVERMVSLLNGLEDNYLSDSFLPLIREIESLSGVDYSTNPRPMRIIADHIKAAVFIIADGVLPGNVEQGYVLRRLIRRAVRHGRQLGLKNFIGKVASEVFKIYDDYKILVRNREKILTELEKEEKKFLEGLDKGMKVFDKMVKDSGKMNGKDAFLLYQSYGFPIEMTQELAKERKIKIKIDEFEKEAGMHRQLSQTSSKGRFASGLGDASVETTKLHTATHLLHAALRKVLGNSVEQKGSNITSERLRFDFSFDRKLSSDEIKEVERLVSKAINDKLDVSMEELSPKDAKESGALGLFEDKYGNKVSVYSVGKGKKLFSKEICTGPHVSNTSELGGFKILKEESSSAGVRRIKAVVGKNEFER
jgi:alanyl-tRNA synthetase